MTISDKRAAVNHETLPNALTQQSQLLSQIKNKKIAAFFDYDGTLTPIVSQPEQAVLSESMRKTIIDFAKNFPVALISGRDKNNLKSLVNIPQLFYAGSHGFEIEGPENSNLNYEVGNEYLPFLKQAFLEVDAQLNSIPNVCVQLKKYCIALHYRNVDEVYIRQIFQAAEQIVQRTPELKLLSGKKILEIRPNMDWHKGKSMQWIAQQRQLNHPEYFHLFFGDDLTDEDAFRSLSATYGIGILVGNHGYPTYADYQLNSTEEVQLFLEILLRKNI